MRDEVKKKQLYLITNMVKNDKNFPRWPTEGIYLTAPSHYLNHLSPIELRPTYFIEILIEIQTIRQFQNKMATAILFTSQFVKIIQIMTSSMVMLST